MPEPVDSHLVPLDPVGELSDRFGDGLELLDAVCGDVLVHRLLRYLEILQRGLVNEKRLLGDRSTGHNVPDSLGPRGQTEAYDRREGNDQGSDKLEGSSATEALYRPDASRKAGLRCELSPRGEHDGTLLCGCPALCRRP